MTNHKNVSNLSHMARNHWSNVTIHFSTSTIIVRGDHRTLLLKVIFEVDLDPPLGNFFSFNKYLGFHSQLLVHIKRQIYISNHPHLENNSHPHNILLTIPLFISNNNSTYQTNPHLHDILFVVSPFLSNNKFT